MIGYWDKPLIVTVLSIDSKGLEITVESRASVSLCSPVFFPATPRVRVVFLPPLLPEALGEEQGGLRPQRGGTVLERSSELEDRDGLGAETSVPAEGQGEERNDLTISRCRGKQEKFGRDAESWVLRCQKSCLTYCSAVCVRVINL